MQHSTSINTSRIEQSKGILKELKAVLL